VAVVPVAPVAVSLLLGAPVASGGVDASVDTDDYQKRSPVESVLDSTENSRVIVSNRVHGKHYSLVNRLGLSLE